MTANKALHPTAIPLRFMVAGRLTRCRGRFAPRLHPADCHPLASRHMASAIKRLQLTGLPVSTLEKPPADGPQGVMLNKNKGRKSLICADSIFNLVRN